VSERELRRAFAAAYGVSPARFLRLRRLHLARSRLRDGPAGTVTDVAVDLGFFDLGRFAGDYRLLFGEFPSATLKRRVAHV
jgi:AraC family transcriptional regulator, ethanolamine operon transcriptional activator